MAIKRDEQALAARRAAQWMACPLQGAQRRRWCLLVSPEGRSTSASILRYSLYQGHGHWWQAAPWLEALVDLL